MITKASLKDAAILTEFGAKTFYNSHRECAPAHVLTTYIKNKYNMDVIMKELSHPENSYHLIKYENKVAGFSKIALNMKHTAIEMEAVSKLDQIYLLDSFKGLKLGSHLLNYNIDISKSCGQNGMWLAVWVGNIAAITFYEKFGFYIVRREDFHLTDTYPSPCYIMLLDYKATSSSSKADLL